MKMFILLLLISSQTAFSTTLKGFRPEFYGFIKSSAMYSTEALGSYHNINLSAPTHAVAQTRSADKTSRISFQTQQSRAGVNLQKGKDVSGKLEFDFIDFNKSSPTVQMNPRVRIAAITYAKDNQKFIIGQDWDLFSPVTAYTYDYVGLYFYAGNTGFMRQQVQYLLNKENWEYGVALGMAGNNPGVVDSDLELAKSPSYSARISHLITDGRLGISGIYSRLNYQTTNGRGHDAFGANAFFERNYDLWMIKSEAYYGKNLANLGALSIGKGTDSKDVKEFGGNITLQRKLAEKCLLFGGLGMAKVDNASEITPYALNTSNVITQPGIRNNFLARLGYEYLLSDDLSFLTEISRYETTSKIALHKYQTNITESIETGMQLRF
jgi:hypothetical protein